MTTKEVADKLVDYCRTGRWDLAQEELYAADAVSIEMEGAQGFPQRVEGMEAIKAICEKMSGVHKKYRAVFYYLLAKHYGKTA